MARTVLETPGEDVGVFGGQFDVYGTTSGGEEITILSGTDVWLDPSFNTGGDTIRLPGEAEEYTARVEGSYVILESTINDVTVEIPVGPNGITIVFGGDDSRTLFYDTTDGRVEMGGDVIDGTADPLSPGTPPPPPVTYTVLANSPTVTEGDSGARALTYTITLDQPAQEDVTITYTTVASGTAAANDDYQPVTGTVTIPAGSTTGFVTVTVYGDTSVEGDETVDLQLSSPDLAATQVLTGTIVDDDFLQTQFNLNPGSETIYGTNSDDDFRASNNELGAGDVVFGLDGNDQLFVFVDPSSPGFGTIDYSGFELYSVEEVLVTNDSTSPIGLDMSGAEGVQLVGSVNSSDDVEFQYVTSLADILIRDITTGPGFTDVRVYYQTSVTAGGNDTVDVTIEDSAIDDLDIGTIDNMGTTTTSGIENVNLIVNGDSSIEDLDTDLTNLNISGMGDLLIDDPLNTTVRDIDATGLVGDLDIDFSNNGVGVDYDGSTGVNIVQGGAGGDNIVTQDSNDIVNGNAGNDVIDTNGGNDTVTGGDGDDSIDVGTGTNTVDAGTGSDFVTATEADGVTLAGGFNTVTAGTGNDTVVLGDGGSWVDLGDGDDDLTTGAGNDTVFTGTGAEDISTGGGTDLVYFYGTLSSADEADLGAGTDWLIVNAGTVDVDYTNVSNAEILLLASAGMTTLAAQAQQAGIMTIYGNSGNDVIDATAFTSSLTVLPSTGDDNIATGSANDTFIFFTGQLNDTDILDANAGDGDALDLFGSTTLATGANVDDFEILNLYNSSIFDDDYTITTDAGWVSTVDGVLTVNGGALGTSDNVVFDASTGDYSVEITTGAAADTITTSLGVYADCVDSGGGNDIIVTNDGSDDIASGSGNDTVTAGSGADLIHLGDGDDTAFGDVGADQFYGGGGADTMWLGVDAQTDTVLYAQLSDSSFAGGDGRDTINDFDSGEDVIDIGELLANNGISSGSTEFITGQDLDQAEAQMVAGDGVYSIVFVEEIPGDITDIGLVNTTGYFFVDLNDDGELGGEDLQVFVNGDDVQAGDVVTSLNLSGQSGYDLFIADHCAFA